MSEIGDDTVAAMTRAAMNRETLALCVGPHVFADVTPETVVGKVWRCSLCGGTASGIERAWYEIGRVHGRLERE